MPTRMLREGLLDSLPIAKCSDGARWLFVAILLQADDVGLFEATEFKLFRRALVDQERGPALLRELEKHGLVRLYSAQKTRFGFVPKFAQRLQIKRVKFPLPPLSLVEDDEDFMNKINHLGLKARLSTVVHGFPPREPEPEPEPEEEKDPPHLTVGTPPPMAVTSNPALTGQGLSELPDLFPIPPAPPPGVAAAKPPAAAPAAPAAAKTARTAKGGPLDVEDMVACGVKPQHAADWLKVRKVHKAPLTQTAWEGIEREAKKAGVSLDEAVRIAAEMSWRGFRADYYANLKGSSSVRMAQVQPAALPRYD